MLEYHNGNIGIGTIYPTQKLDISGNLKTSGNILTTDIICSNLTVSGTSTIVNTSALDISDIIISLGGNTILTTYDNKDRGIKFSYYDEISKLGFFGFDNSTQKLVYLLDASDNNFVLNGTYGDIQASNFLGNLIGNASTVTDGVYITGNQNISGIKNFTNSVGIGSSIPFKTLDVSGGINFTDNLYKNGQLYISSQWTDSNQDLFFTRGNIGIGSTIPFKTLDVSGGINFTDNLYKNGQLYISSQWSDASNNKDLFFTRGKIGIGSTIPFKTLDVSGGINFTDNLYKNGQLYISSQWTDSSNNQDLFFTRGKIGIGSSIPFKTLDVSGGINFTDNLYKNGVLFSNSYEWKTFDATLLGSMNGLLDISNSKAQYVQIDRYIKVDVILKYSISQTIGLYDTVRLQLPQASINSKDDMVGTAVVKNNNNEYVNFIAFLNNDSTVYFSTSDKNKFGNNGVTSTPLNWSSFNSIWISLTYESASSQVTLGNVPMAFTSDVSSNGYVINNFVVNNGNIGIGTSNPSRRLDIVGDINLSGSIYKDGLIYSNYSPWDVLGPHIFNLNTGNVGIGVNNPQYNIDVSGNINCSGEFYKSDTLMVSSQWISNNGIYYDGNIGIGTNNPQSKLDVSGNITPTITEIFDLGSATKRWKNLYLSGNSIDLNGAKIIKDTSTNGIKIVNSNGDILDGRFNNINIVGDLYKNNQIYKASRWDINGSNINYTTGNVGIGTNIIPKSLTITGDIQQNNNGMSVIQTSNGNVIISEIGNQYIGYNIAWTNIITNDKLSIRVSGKSHISASITEYAYRRFDILISPYDSSPNYPGLLINAETSNFTTNGYSNLEHDVLRITDKSVDVRVKWSSSISSYISNLQLEIFGSTELGTITTTIISGTF